MSKTSNNEDHEYNLNVNKFNLKLEHNKSYDFEAKCEVLTSTCDHSLSPASKKFTIKTDFIFTPTSIAQESDGTIWVGTPLGLYQFANGGWSERILVSETDEKSSNVLVVGVDSNGIKWIGTQDQGLALFDDSLGGSGWAGPIRAGLHSLNVSALAFLPRGLVLPFK